MVNLRRKEAAGVFLLLLLAAAVFTWPLAVNMHQAIPQGSEPESVACFQMFTMKWTAQTLAQPAAYWHAQFFFPFAGAFAWCEPQLFNALIVTLLAKLFGVTAGYNILILAYMALMGLAGYVAARLLTTDRVAAFFSGLWLCSGAFSLQQICAPALLSAWSIFFFILFIFQYARTAGKRYFWLSAFCYLVAWFTMKQSALMVTLFLPCILWPWFAQPAKNRHLFTGIAALLLLTAAIVAPYAAQQWYLSRAMGFERAIAEVSSVRPLSLFTPAQGHWFSSRISGITRYSWDIGIMACSILAAATAGGFLRRNTFDAEQKKVSAALLTLACAGLLFAFGPEMQWYRFVFANIPGFGFIRAPGRNMVFAIFSVGVLSAPAFAWLRGSMKKSRRKIVTAAVYVLLCAEMWAMPVPLVSFDEEVNGHRGAIEWLKNNEPSAPVIELPLKQKNHEMEAAAMLRMLEHKHPLINGYASFSPLPYTQLKQALLTDLQTRGLRFLKAYGARYVLVHQHLLLREDFSFLKDFEVFQDANHAIYRLPEPLYIGKEERILPEKSYFGLKKPAQGKRYAMPLKQPLFEAGLIYTHGTAIPMEWKTAGRKESKVLSLRGAVILDKGADAICFRMLRFSADDRAAEGIVIECN